MHPPYRHCRASAPSLLFPASVSITHVLKKEQESSPPPPAPAVVWDEGTPSSKHRTCPNTASLLSPFPNPKSLQTPAHGPQEHLCPLAPQPPTSSPGLPSPSDVIDVGALQSLKKPTLKRSIRGGSHPISPVASTWHVVSISWSLFNSYI